MGKVKEKLQEISELIQSQLDSGVDIEDLDSYMELELSLPDYAFYLENKDTILNFFEGLKAKGKMLAERQNFTRGLDPKDAMETGDVELRKLLKKAEETKTAGERMYLLDDMITFFQDWRVDKGTDKYNTLVKLLKERHPLESIDLIKDNIKWYLSYDVVDESFYPILESYWDGRDDDEDEEEENDNKVPEAHEEAPHLYYNSEGNYQKEYDYYSKKLIPMSGNSDTIQGELLRCLSSIIHDRYNNGFGNDRKEPTQQLLKYASKFEPYLKHPNIFKVFYKYYYDINFGHNRYVENNWIGDKYFDPIMDAILKYIMNSEKFEPLPEEDKFFKQ